MSKRTCGYTSGLLGNGVRAFDRAGEANVKLERLSLSHAPGGDERLRIAR